MSVFAESIDIPTFENCFARTRNDSPQMTPPIQSCAPKPEFRVCRNWGSKKKKEGPPPSARHSPLHFRIYVEDSFRRLWEERGEHLPFPPYAGALNHLLLPNTRPKNNKRVICNPSTSASSPPSSWWPRPPPRRRTSTSPGAFADAILTIRRFGFFGC